MKTTLHEMYHAMGQMHEQSRSDRDTYIDVFYDNAGNNNSVKKSNTMDLNPYDLESVMHYSLYVSDFVSTLFLHLNNLIYVSSYGTSWVMLAAE